jgi:hypothetical protein
MDDPVITPTLLRDYRDRFSDFQLVTVDGVGLLASLDRLALSCIGPDEFGTHIRATARIATRRF